MEGLDGMEGDGWVRNRDTDRSDIVEKGKIPARLDKLVMRNIERNANHK